MWRRVTAHASGVSASTAIHRPTRTRAVAEGAGDVGAPADLHVDPLLGVGRSGPAPGLLRRRSPADPRTEPVPRRPRATEGIGRGRPRRGRRAPAHDDGRGVGVPPSPSAAVRGSIVPGDRKAIMVAGGAGGPPDARPHAEPSGGPAAGAAEDLVGARHRTRTNPTTTSPMGAEPSPTTSSSRSPRSTVPAAGAAASRPGGASPGRAENLLTRSMRVKHALVTGQEGA
jgi:hypothetical protein